MSSPHEPWLDEQLQAVPLPEGLLARLRQIAGGTDEELDAALRKVPVAEALLVNLRAIPHDAALDERLADLPVPAELLAGLKAIAEETPEDAVAVEHPPTPRVPAREPAFSWARFTLWTSAACVALVAGGAFFFSTQEGQSLRDQVVRLVLGEGEPDPLEIPPLVHPQPPLEIIPMLADRPADDGPTPIAFASDIAPLPRLGPDHDLFRLAQEQPLSQSLWMLRWGNEILSSPTRENIRDLEQAANLAPRGLQLPVAPGYDRVFQLKTGVHPIVSPAAHASLAQSLAPLVTRTGSYDHLRQLLTRGELPAADRIRVEEFIAATGVAGPLPRPGEIDVRLAAGPSPLAAARSFGTEGAQRLPPGKPHLLAVQVAAGSVAPKARRGTHLVVALDGSESMRWGNRFEHARRGLADLARLLGPHDRLTIVRLGTQAEVLVDRAAGDDLAHLETTLAHMPRGPIDLGEGLRLAGDLAVQPLEEPRDRELVVITDGVEGMPADREARLGSLLAALGEQKVGVLLLDVSGPSAPRGGLARLAEQGAARVMTADSGTEVRAALVEALTGGSSVLGEEAVLTVKFNPTRVAGYRLLGHEGSLAGGLIAAGAESTILAGDHTTVLFEVWLVEGMESDVASATLAWHQGSAGEARQRRAELLASELAASWDSLPQSVQAAAIAAEAADALRGSYFAAGRNRDLRPVLALADRTSATLSTDASFKEFLSVLRAAEQARVTRRVP